MSNRDDFSLTTKRILAERVAYQCSFPGCPIITVGPQKGNQNKSTKLGTAAHITAASPNGPRYNPSLSPSERKSIENGIWMCKQHADLIDNDWTEYTVETLKLWKAKTEDRAYQNLINPGTITNKQLTLIQISSKCIFYGEWIKIEGLYWSFLIDKFVLGDDVLTNDISLKINEGRMEPNEKFVVVESQGEGREINNKSFITVSNNGKKIITVQIIEKSERNMVPDNVIDLKLGRDGDIIFEDGDVAIVEGKDAALQSIYIGIGTMKGDRLYNPYAGSVFSFYFWKFKENKSLLNSLLKIEIARLLSMPIYDGSKEKESPPFDFINRIHDVEILDYELDENNRIPIKINIEFADNSTIIDTNFIYIYDENSAFLLNYKNLSRPLTPAPPA
jgi:hypothetical protein